MIRLEVNGVLKDSDQISFEDWRLLMKEVLRDSPAAGAIWDLMCCQRGPDSPSERPDMPSEESSRAYKGRRERKFKTVEVIRRASFYGPTGGCARSRTGSSVTLPHPSKWDHFDQHVERAARLIGLEIKLEEK